MDLFHRNLPNANHYDQIRLEDDQHASQPEVGQTSTGIAASGPSRSHPAPGQLQPYQNFNFSPWIPPSTGFDREHTLRSPQPTTLGDIIQSDALSESSNPQTVVKKRQRKSLAEVKHHFLAGLDKYAQGYRLTGCSAAISYSSYVTADGNLHQDGIGLYEKLEQEEKDRVDQALEDRKVFHSFSLYSANSTRMRFMEGIEAYASGAPLKDCSATLRFARYVTSDGHLLARGIGLCEKLNQEELTLVNRALEARRKCYDESTRHDKSITNAAYKHLAGGESTARVNEVLAVRRRIAAERISGDVSHFLAALEPYGNGFDLKECGKQSGLKRKADRYQKVERYLTPEGGLTAKGELLIENLQPDQLNKVLEAIEKRQQNTGLHSPVPEPAWQWPEMPASMPETEGMDPGLNPPVPEPAWQWPEMSASMPETEGMDPGLNPPVPEPAWQWPEMPASMPETEGMDPIAMYPPMQTEAMMAAAWQYTGQTMPGTWGIPWESAEPFIPHYGSDVVGNDFRHRYDSNGLMPQRAPDRLIGLGIVHDMLINIQGEEYRVHDTGQRSVNLTNENPQGKIIMLVPRMRGG
ncbi:MAG: hypothetical protein P8X89_17085 [Reinekea sp.]